jgi:hypothetical protein
MQASTMGQMHMTIAATYNVPSSNKGTLKSPFGALLNTIKQPVLVRC